MRPEEGRAPGGRPGFDCPASRFEDVTDRLPGWRPAAPGYAALAIATGSPWWRPAAPDSEPSGLGLAGLRGRRLRLLARAVRVLSVARTALVVGVTLARRTGARAGTGRRRRAEAGKTRWRGGRSLLGLRRARLWARLRGEAAGGRAGRVAAVLRAIAGLLIGGLLLAVIAAVLAVVLVVLGARGRSG